MNLLVPVLALALVAVVVFVVSGPLRVARQERDPPDPERGDLQAAREAKYREIRDAEMDYRTGKLSRADYEAIDSELRAEALAILNRLERSGDEPLDAGAGAGETTPRDA